MGAEEKTVAGRGAHPNSRANLRPPWKPGESGNLRGRPREIISKPLRQILEGESGGGEGKTVADELAQLIADIALGKVQASPTQMRAMEMIQDRLEGRARQSISVTVGDREKVERAVEDVLRQAEAAGEPKTRAQVLEKMAKYGDEIAALMLEEES